MSWTSSLTTRVASTTLAAASSQRSKNCSSRGIRCSFMVWGLLALVERPSSGTEHPERYTVEPVIESMEKGAPPSAFWVGAACGCAREWLDLEAIRTVHRDRRPG